MRHYLEFLNGIDNGRDSIRAEESGKVTQAVGKKVVASVGRAVDGGERKISTLCNRRGKATHATSHSVLPDADRHHARSQRQQLREVAAVEGQIVHLSCRNNRAQFCGGGLKLL